MLAGLLSVVLVCGAGSCVAGGVGGSGGVEGGGIGVDGVSGGGGG